MYSALCFAALLVGQDSLPSGPAVGDKLGDFKIKGVFGPHAGKEFQFAKETKGQPSLILFVHKISRPAVQLIRPVDAYAAKHEKLAAHIIFLSDDKDETEALVKRAQNSLNLQLPLGICLDGKTGPESYGLNDMVAMTILLAKDGKVTNNFAFVDPNDTDGPKVVAAVAKLLGKEPPATTKSERPAGELRDLVIKLVKKSDDEAKAKQHIADIQKFVGDDRAKKQELKQIAQRALNFDIENETVKKALKEWAEK